MDELRPGGFSTLVESLKRNYMNGHVSKEKIDQMFSIEKINQDERVYILADEPVTKE